MGPLLVPNNTILQYSRGRIFDDVMSNRNFTPSCRLIVEGHGHTLNYHVRILRLVPVALMVMTARGKGKGEEPDEEEEEVS